MTKVFIVLAILLIAGVTLRVTGEHYYSVVPTPIPKVDIDQDTFFYRVVQDQLADAPAQQPNFFYPLGNAKLALISRIQLAQEAEARIDAQYYLFHDDLAGRALLAALIAAAERGVKVRLLLDDMDVPGREALLTRLAADYDNFEIRVFNPTWLRKLKPLEYAARFPRVTRRMHNKSFTVDSVLSIVGGRNVGDEYFAVGDAIPFTDLDVLGGGEVAQKTETEFLTYWHSGLAYPVAYLGIAAAADQPYQAWRKQLDSALADYQSAEQREKVVERLLSTQLQPYYAEADVIYDQPSKVLSALTDQTGHLAPAILKLMGSAQKQLLIASPYFIPGKSGIQLFRSLRERGVEVIILTNSLAANDVAAVHSGYMKYRKDLLELGVQLYELKANDESDYRMSFLGSKNASLHAKSFIVDQKIVYVGSFNLDPRSAVHNTEMGVVFDNARYGQEAAKGFSQYFVTRAYQIGLDDHGKIVWHAEDAAGQKTAFDKEPETNLFQRVVVKVISWLPIQWLL